MRDAPPDAEADMATAAGDVPAELMVWLSPSFPAGSFAYSQGLEQAALRGWVIDRGTLEDWLAAVVSHGALRGDLIVLAQAWRAARAQDAARVAAVNDLALALQPSAERHLETTQQGKAFATTLAAAWLPRDDTRAHVSLLVSLTGDVAYPVAVGIAAAERGFNLEGSLLGYAIAATMNAVSAAIRLSVIGQTDGQRVLARLIPALRVSARTAKLTTLDDIGSATFAADLASLAHETQYSRLFRS